MRTHKQHADTYVAAPESWPTYVLAKLQSTISGESLKSADQNLPTSHAAGRASASKTAKESCKQNGGASICEYNRVRGQCKQCGGSGICELNRQRNQCKQYDELLALGPQNTRASNALVYTCPHAAICQNTSLYVSLTWLRVYSDYIR